jgi:hypothetical protein
MRLAACGKREELGMKKLIMIAAMIAAFGLGTAAAFAANADKPANPGGGNDGQVCPPGDSGKIDVNSGASVTVTAPDGKLISGYCVKAGSANQGLGPEFVTVDPPQKTVTITHSSGKDVSHYSLTYVDEGQTTTTETTTTETTTTETTTTETTTTETETTETTSTETTPNETTPTETTPTETTPTETAPTETAPTESTSTETTPAETTVEEQEAEEQQEQVFTPPTQGTRVEGQTVAGAAAQTAPKPNKAAQPAPFTP